MKKSVKITKRIFSLFMALIMASTVLVFAFPANAVCEDGAHVTMETKEAKAPNCTEDGCTSELTCKNCGIIVQASTVLRKSGHNYSEWVIDSQPTYFNDGHAHAECQTCHDVYNYTIPKMTGSFDCDGHTYTTGEAESDYKVIIPSTCSMTGIKAHYCTKCGSSGGVENYVEIPLASHNYGDVYISQYATCEEGEVTWHECENCGFVEEMHGGALGHIWYEWELTFAGTCKEKAYETRTCDRCKTVERHDLNKYGSHTYVADEYVAPTCLSKGLSRGYHCTTCGYVDKEQEEIPMLKHIDKDGDFYCDMCKITYVPCSCICHNTSGIMGTIAKLIIFIWKLLGRSRECKCGAEHYYVYKPA